MSNEELQQIADKHSPDFREGPGGRWYWDLEAVMACMREAIAAEQVRTKSAQQAGMATMSEEDIRRFWRKHHDDSGQGR